MNKGRIDLVMLDMIMPGLSGSDTYDALKLIDPEVKVMLSTGYRLQHQRTGQKDNGKGLPGADPETVSHQ
jgi:CheY-like chemotaxis protein